MGKTVAEKLQIVDDVFTDGAKHGVMLQRAEDTSLNGRTIRMDGRDVINFGSCSYLGLEMDSRLREGVIDAVTRYGTQFSSSRSYVSAPAYEHLTGMLDELFGAPAMIASSTSLGHVAVIPSVVAETDAIILDQQVHHSVSSAANQARVQGTHIEMIRHNRMDLLEERITDLAQRHAKVWYLADGVYSMFADFAPYEDLHRLLADHPKLHLYIDDSHGMSWYGPNGRGVTLTNMPMHDRMVVACSLNKAFACAGGAFLFPDEDMRRHITVVGGPMIFSGPVQPPMLGAALASAAIHLSDDIYGLQKQLADRVTFYNTLVEEAGLPLLSASEAPIRYIGVGVPRIAYRAAQKLLDDGMYVNVAPFPAVPMKQGGLRTPLTVHHTYEDIERLVDGMRRHVPAILKEEGGTIDELAASFRIDVPANWPKDTGVYVPAGASAMRVEHHRHVSELDAGEWDSLFAGYGTWDVGGLQFLHDTFGQETGVAEDDWSFHYLIVRDTDGEPVAATFLTSTQFKDDMLSAARVSARVEQLRADDPYFLTSRTLTMGSLLSEGRHLYLNRDRDWKAALRLLLAQISDLQKFEDASQIVLRDFPDVDDDLDRLLRDSGFARVSMLPTMQLNLQASEEQWLAQLSAKARRHQRKQVLPYVDLTETEILRVGGRALRDGELEHLYGLYRNVHARGLDINVFALPKRTFVNMLTSPRWEMLITYPRGQSGATDAIAFGGHYTGVEHYAPMVIGLDYSKQSEYHVYRVAVMQMIRRARSLGVRRIDVGMGATLEKRRFGAHETPNCAYVQSDDLFHADLLGQIEADAVR